MLSTTFDNCSSDVRIKLKGEMMLRIARVCGLALVILVLAGMLAACGALSGPQVEAEDVWARPAMAMKESVESSEEGMGTGMQGTGAVFMLLKNEGGDADRLVGGQTDVAKVVEIHETVMEGDVMKMQMLADGLEVPAKGEVLLKPGSYHVMLIGMERDLKVGDKFALDLQFEKSGTITVESEVREP
jgi:copper(I)-binding protein